MGGLTQTATGWVETDTVEVVARRKTSEGSVVEFWNDGSVTLTRLGFTQGRAPKSKDGKVKAIEANRILAGEISLYDNDEVRKAVKAARAAVKQKRLPPLIHFRRKMAGVKKEPKPASPREQRKAMARYMKEKYGA